MKRVSISQGPRATMKIMAVIGTRPEAIKMAPVVKAFAADARFDVKLVVTAQHREMLDSVLAHFDLEPDHDLDLMRQRQTLAGLTARALEGLTQVITDEAPDMVLVHGDTTTTMAGAIAAFYAGVPVGHVEAGLRTGDLRAPFPEEFNRRVAGIVTRLHFAPTEGAADHLRAEGVPENDIFVTGNSVIDALIDTVDRVICEDADPVIAALDADKRMILVTGHRRENHGEGFEQICDALATLADRDDVEIVYPVHLNPNVKDVVHERLGGRSNVHLIAPTDYPAFVDLMQRSVLILTDSGGVQEEAPSLGKPVLVMRETTERPEAVDAGTVKLVGADADRIVKEATRLLDDKRAYRAMARAQNPYGDGKASARILAAVADYLETA